jgi:hypothetical protein
LKMQLQGREQRKARGSLLMSAFSDPTGQEKQVPPTWMGAVLARLDFPWLCPHQVPRLPHNVDGDDGDNDDKYKEIVFAVGVEIA